MYIIHDHSKTRFDALTIFDLGQLLPLHIHLGKLESESRRDKPVGTVALAAPETKPLEVCEVSMPGQNWGIMELLLDVAWYWMILTDLCRQLAANASHTDDRHLEMLMLILTDVCCALQPFQKRHLCRCAVKKRPVVTSDSVRLRCETKMPRMFFSFDFCRSIIIYTVYI